MPFTWQSRVSAIQHNAASINAMSRYTAANGQQLTAKTEHTKCLKQSGWLKIYESEKSFASMDNARNLTDKLTTDRVGIATGMRMTIQVEFAVLGTITAYIISDLITNQKLRRATGAYSPNRFKIL